jgi:hypothetical protein
MSQSEQSDFHLKRVTQSQYRGGSTRLSPDIEDRFTNRTIPPIKLNKKEDKEQLRTMIIERTDVILENVLPEKTVDEIKQSDYLDDIYKQVGL